MNNFLFSMWMLGSFPYVNTNIGCAFDKQAIRQDDQEKEFLQQSAQMYWDGIRWGIPAKSAVYYEDSLVRSRWEKQPSPPYSRVTEVKILHIEIQENIEGDKSIVETATTLKKATVYVYVQGIASDNTLKSRELQQNWYRTSVGWFVSVDNESLH